MYPLLTLYFLEASSERLQTKWTSGAVVRALLIGRPYGAEQRAYLATVLIPEQLAEGVVGGLKGPQLLQEKVLLTG